MKKILAQLIHRLEPFLSDKEKQLPKEAPLVSQKTLATIDRALAEKAAVYIIFGKQNFTGHILRYDQQKSQLVVENFKGSITMIIAVEEIRRISILPASLQKIAQA